MKRQDSKPRRHNTYRGVCRCHNQVSPYTARLGTEYLGDYETPEQAALAYDERALERYGEQAITNFSPDIVKQKKRIQFPVARRNNITGLRGVNWHSGRGQYRARIGYKGQSIHLGWFDDPLEAANAYNDKAAELYGTAAHLNDLSGGDA